MMDRKDHKADMGHKYRYAKKRKIKKINTWELFMISAVPTPLNKRTEVKNECNSSKKV